MIQADWVEAAAVAELGRAIQGKGQLGGELDRGTQAQQGKRGGCLAESIYHLIPALSFDRHLRQSIKGSGA